MQASAGTRNGRINRRCRPGAVDTSNGDPSSGRLRITDAQGDRLLITARGTLVDREFFLAGNTTGTPDAALIGTPWSAFRQ